MGHVTGFFVTLLLAAELGVCTAMLCGIVASLLSSQVGIVLDVTLVAQMSGKFIAGMAVFLLPMWTVRLVRR